MYKKRATKTVALVLGWLGLLPFIMGCVAAYVDYYPFGLYGPLIFVSYSAVILAFVSGVLWGRVIEKTDTELAIPMLVASNLFALGGFFSLLIAYVYLPMAIALLGVSFLLLLYLEKSVLTVLPENDWYKAMRRNLTIGVVVMHGLLLIVLMF